MRDSFSYLRPLLHLGQPEVQDLGVPAIRNQNVRGLDVTVDYPLRVRGIQRIDNFCSQFQYGTDTDRFSAYPVLERLSPQQLHRDEVLAVRFVDFVNLTDVRRIE